MENVHNRPIMISNLSQITPQCSYTGRLDQYLPEMDQNYRVHHPLLRNSNNFSAQILRKLKQHIGIFEVSEI